MSLTVIRPLSMYWSSTTSSFSTRLRCRMASACSSVVPTGTVTRLSLVITSEIAIGKDAHQLAVLGHRHARNAIARHQFLRSRNRQIGRDRNGVDDHTAF